MGREEKEERENGKRKLNSEKKKKYIAIKSGIFLFLLL